MTPRKKLIEVALPLSAINDASAYDKMPGIGPHPKGIHHWWARLPLPAARAVLFASLVDDPSANPAFVDQPESVQDQERERLFGVIRQMLQKRIHENKEAFLVALEEINRTCGDELPIALDPFCGGGSIPLEAQRLGLEVNASDLNPVALIINKAALEIVPKFADFPPINPHSTGNALLQKNWGRAKGLAEDVRFYGQKILDEARNQLGHLYPLGPNNQTVVAWLWTRTVKSPNPAVDFHVPLVRSFVIRNKKGNKTWIQPHVDSEKRAVVFEVISGKGDMPSGTVVRSGARCIATNTPIPFDYIRAEGRAKRIQSQLLAIVTDGDKGRNYYSPTAEHEFALRLEAPLDAPDTNLPEQALGFRIQRYGITKHRDLFTPRQLLALTTLSSLIKGMRTKIYEDAVNAGYWAEENDKPLHQGGQGAFAYAEAITTFLALALDRCADFNNAFCRWSPTNEKVMNLVGAQRISMIWDYAEANIMAESVGGWKTCNDYVAECIEVIPAGANRPGYVYQMDAASTGRKGRDFIVSTDPPYYNNIGYADLSDFFYVWLRQTLKDVYPDLLGTMLVPKAQELIADEARFGGKAQAKEHFESGFRKAFSLLRERLAPSFPMTVYYAFKQSEDEDDEQGEDGQASDITLTTGWETLLEALMSTGFQITGTWPVRASQTWRMRSMGSNALASYIVLVCRPREENASMASRRQFIDSLRRELPSALRKLQSGNIAPVDLAQASIGPGMAIYSRYSKVSEANGSPMTVRTALQLINQELDIFLTEQEGELDADSRFAVSWFEQFAFDEGEFGQADVLARAKNTSVEGVQRAEIVEAGRGKVRLLHHKELDLGWEPSEDNRLTVWETVNHLIARLNHRGESGAAALLVKLPGDLGSQARELAYRLYNICERKGWADHAYDYNSLVISWPSIVEQAGEIRKALEENRATQQGRLFE